MNQKTEILPANYQNSEKKEKKAANKLKASNFSLNSCNYLLEQLSSMNYTSSSNKVPIKFTMGNLSAYGRPEISLPYEGYDSIRKAIGSQTNHGYNNSQGIPAARSALAKVFSGPSFPLTEKDIFITNGSGIALLYCLLAFCDELDNILVPDVGFPFFINAGKIYNVQVKTYKLNPKDNWKLDLQDLETKIDSRSKFIFLINPTNPLGTVYPKEHLIELLALAKKKGIAIVADEIYAHMVFKNTDFISIGHLTEEVPVITMCALDKLFLAGGWAIGWLCFYDRFGILDDVKKGMANLAQIYLHPTTFIQAGLPEFLEKVPLTYVKENIMPFLEENRDFLKKEIDSIEGLEMIVPMGTPNVSILVKIKEFCIFKNDKEFAQKFMEEENVATVPLSCFYYDGELQDAESKIQGFRILSCAKKEDYVELVERLKDFTEKYRRRK